MEIRPPPFFRLYGPGGLAPPPPPVPAEVLSTGKYQMFGETHTLKPRTTLPESADPTRPPGFVWEKLYTVDPATEEPRDALGDLTRLTAEMQAFHAGLLRRSAELGRADDDALLRPGSRSRSDGELSGEDASGEGGEGGEVTRVAEDATRRVTEYLASLASAADALKADGMRLQVYLHNVLELLLVVRRDQARQRFRDVLKRVEDDARRLASSSSSSAAAAAAAAANDDA